MAGQPRQLDVVARRRERLGDAAHRRRVAGEPVEREDAPARRRVGGRVGCDRGSAPAIVIGEIVTAAGGSPSQHDVLSPRAGGRSLGSDARAAASPPARGVGGLGVRPDARDPAVLPARPVVMWWLVGWCGTCPTGCSPSSTASAPCCCSSGRCRRGAHAAVRCPATDRRRARRDRAAVAPDRPGQPPPGRPLHPARAPARRAERLRVRRPPRRGHDVRHRRAARAASSPACSPTS